MYDLIDMLKEAAGTIGESSVTVVTSAYVCKVLGGDNHFTITTNDGKVFYDIGDIEELFNTFDKLLLDGCTYSITVYPAMSLTLMTNAETYVITCDSMIHDDLIELRETVDFHRNSVIVPVRKVIHNVFKRISMPLRVTINYITMAAAHEETHKSPKIIVSETEPESSRINIPKAENVLFADESDVKSKGYTNVIVGHEDEIDPDKHLKSIIAEVQQHMENVKNNNTRVTETNQTLEDLHITNNEVSPEDVEAHRRKVFEEGRLALAKEAKRKEEQSTEDDFAV